MQQFPLPAATSEKPAQASTSARDLALKALHQAALASYNLADCLFDEDDIDEAWAQLDRIAETMSAIRARSFDGASAKLTVAMLRLNYGGSAVFVVACGAALAASALEDVRALGEGRAA